MYSIRTLSGQVANSTSGCEALMKRTVARLDAMQADADSAFTQRLPEADLLERARGWDALQQSVRRPSLLAGLPISVKDLFDVAGSVTTAGSALLRDAAEATTDATSVRRLRDAGAIIVGRTNMSEFAYSGLGVNPHYGTPANPYAKDRVAGGSSSGAAVSVASGACVAALGTDTGGSIRIPAAWCGLAGFKPTARSVPQAGVFPLSRSLDSVGPIALTADCCSILYEILSGEPLDYSDIPLRGLRLAVITDYVLDGLNPEVARAFDRALSLLTKSGVRIEEVSFPEISDIPGINRNGGIVAAESYALHKHWLEQRADVYDPRVRRRIVNGAGITATDYSHLLDERIRLIDASYRRLARFDAWLMPTVATMAPRIDELDDDDAFFRLNALTLRNPSVVNMLDGCALTIRIPDEEGLPVGISFCGLPGNDARILEIGRSVERNWRPEGNPASNESVTSSPL